MPRPCHAVAESCMCATCLSTSAQRRCTKSLADMEPSGRSECEQPPWLRSAAARLSREVATRLTTPYLHAPTLSDHASSAPPCLHRSGTNKETRGTAYVVFEDIHDAKQACDHLSGFNVQNRRAQAPPCHGRACGPCSTCLRWSIQSHAPPVVALHLVDVARARVAGFFMRQHCHRLVVTPPGILSACTTTPPSTTAS